MLGDEFETLALNLCTRPGMYVGGESFVAVCAYLHGFDTARDFGPLSAFKEWLVLRQGSGNNLAWEGLVLIEAFQPKAHPAAEALSPADNELAISTLKQLLAAFFQERRRRSALPILYEYAKWLRRQRWYKGPLRPEK